MLRFVALILALSAVAYAEVSESDQLGDRIIGGINTAIEDVPWQVSLRRNRVHFCGGSIISPMWVVSAAHCTIGMTASTLGILAGTDNRLFGGQLHQGDLIINHPSYDSRTFDNDISLIRVTAAFTLTNEVRAVGLPNQGAGVNTGAYGIVSGWGTIWDGASILPTWLQSIWVPVVDQATCNAAYLGGIRDNMLCAGYLTGGKDACQGDSGGPLVVNGQLVGVVSWGRGCARPNFPGVYARVSNYRDWISTNTGV